MGSIIDPEEEARKALTEKVVALGKDISIALGELESRYGVSVPNEFFLQQRLELLIDKVLPRWGMTAGELGYSAEEMPTNLERLEFEANWHIEVAAMLDKTLVEARRAKITDGVRDFPQQ